MAGPQLLVWLVPHVFPAVVNKHMPNRQPTTCVRAVYTVSELECDWVVFERRVLRQLHRLMPEACRQIGRSTRTPPARYSTTMRSRRRPLAPNRRVQHRQRPVRWEVCRPTGRSTKIQAVARRFTTRRSSLGGGDVRYRLLVFLQLPQPLCPPVPCLGIAMMMPGPWSPQSPPLRRLRLRGHAKIFHLLVSFRSCSDP